MCAHDVARTLADRAGIRYGPCAPDDRRIVLGIWIVLATVVFLTAYVYRDARRRGMNAALWTFIVLMMLPAYFAGLYPLLHTARASAVSLPEMRVPGERPVQLLLQLPVRAAPDLRKLPARGQVGPLRTILRKPRSCRVDESGVARTLIPRQV